MRSHNTVPLAIAASVLALTMTSCAQSDRAPGTSAPVASGTDASFTFGAAGAPKVFDPFYATDGETFRVTRQIFQSLVGFKPGTAEVEPELATEWKSTPDGLTWTFTLREGVKFHDDTDFNADAVCKNFARMFGQVGAGATNAVSQYWSDNFGGFKDGKDPSLFKSCEAPDATHAVIKINRVTSKFPAVLGLSSFAMQSPTAMDKYKANDVKIQGEGFTFSEYATAHPTGTGPFRFDKYDAANKTINLVRNDEYWDDSGKAKVAKLTFKIIPDESTRRQELVAGSIDGYDLPNPIDWKSLKDKGFKIEVRPAFNILYLGLNPKSQPKLTDLRVRQALLYALNREQLVKTQLPEGATVASQFMPDTVTGYNKDVTKYSYDPAKAKSLLAAAGASGMSLDLWYPSEVTRPYMPDPKRIFDAVRKDFEAVGIKVKPVTKPWNGGYLDQVDAGKAPAFFLGWTGDYNTPDNFIGTFFGSTTNRFLTKSYPWGQKLADDLKAADSMPDEAKRTEAYKQLNNQLVTQYLPALPLTHSPPALVVSSKVDGLVASPLSAEEFNTVTVKK